MDINAPVAHGNRYPLYLQATSLVITLAVKLPYPPSWIYRSVGNLEYILSLLGYLYQEYASD